MFLSSKSFRYITESTYRLTVSLYVIIYSKRKCISLICATLHHPHFAHFTILLLKPFNNKLLVLHPTLDCNVAMQC